MIFSAPWRPAFAVLVAMSLIPCAAASADEASADDADSARGIEFFEKKIRPVLVKHCYECHSGDSRILQGGLRVDHRAGLLEGGDSGPAVVPGRPGESVLLEALRFESYEMPPEGKLPEEVIADFERWLAMGAPDPRTDAAPLADAGEAWADKPLWSLQPIGRPEPPEVKQADWPRSPIDHFILARLEAQGLSPAADAERAALLRRLWFDLIGLPPPPEAIREFLADTREDAVKRVVDELLASEHFGERWGRHWLDLARYADSNGGDFNVLYFNAWRYRDYVIDSFNRDRPFDDFIRQQLAGDLLPYGNEQEQAENLVATGFLMVGPKMLSERDKEKLELDLADDQVDTIGRTFLGMTLGCARCHDHKFDPVPATDYYAMAGIFTSTETIRGERQRYVSAWVERPLPLSAAAAAADKRQNDAVAKLQANVSKLEAQRKELAKKLADPQQGLAGVVVDDDRAQLKGDWKTSTYTPIFVGSGYRHDDKAGKGSKTATFTPDLPEAGEFEVRVAYTGVSGRATNVPITVRHAQGEAGVVLDQSKPAKLEGLFQVIGRWEFSAGKGGSVTISNAGTSGHVIIDAVQFVPVRLLDEGKLEPDQGMKLAIQAAEIEQKLAEAREELAKGKQDALPKPMAMAAGDKGTASDLALRVRGEPSRKGNVIPRGFLSAVPVSNSFAIAEKQSGRLELAEWLVDGENPLTSRVAVNRIWHHLFGAGLVRSVDNFGHLGEAPSHPELLDYLARRFMEEGWSTKKLIRELVLTRTYQMRSGHEETAFAADPDNRLLWRANRRRLSAEAIRDALLAASGRLDATVGGSTVTGIAETPPLGSGSLPLERDIRRSVYHPIIRNDLPPILEVFDLANPELVTGARPQTTVPAQALVFLNSPFVRRAAADLAARLEPVADPQERLREAYLAVLGRQPREAEVRRDLDFLSTMDADGWSDLCQALFGSSEFRFLE